MVCFEILSIYKRKVADAEKRAKEEYDRFVYKLARDDAIREHDRYWQRDDSSRGLGTLIMLE